jgi:hypothetical protein
LKAILPAATPFDANTTEEICVLWQLRHSIVHTGAWLTFPDAQKIQPLASWGGKPIIFEHTFVNAVARRFHSIVKGCNASLQSAATKALGTAASLEATQSFQAFLDISSPKSVWLA